MKVDKKKIHKYLEEYEKDFIEKSLIENDYNLQRTCRKIGVARNTLKTKIKKYKIEVKIKTGRRPK